MRVFGAQMEDGTPPEVVAEAIFRAATEDGPVHVPVGEDSELWVRAHANHEEWVSIFVSGCENPRKDGDESGVSCASLDVGCRAGRLSGVA
jgi:hypothetical protein